MSEPAATYHEAQDRALDRLRYLLGDYDMNAPLLPDLTYLAILAQQFSDERLTAIQIGDGLLAKYALMPTSMSNSTGESIAWANRLKYWSSLVARLRAEIALAATPNSFDVLRPTRPGCDDRAEYRRERGDVECW